MKVWDHPTRPTHIWVNCPRFDRFFFFFFFGGGGVGFPKKKCGVLLLGSVKAKMVSVLQEGVRSSGPKGVF